MPELMTGTLERDVSSRASTSQGAQSANGGALLDRVLDAIGELAPAVAGGADVWARGAGPHVLLGLSDDEAFARLTPLGGGLFGLAFRALEARASHTNAWEPLLLIDELPAVVEHALVAVEAIVIQ